MNVWGGGGGGGNLESACLSVGPYVLLSVCLSVYRITNFCQRSGGGIESHVATALVCKWCDYQCMLYIVFKCICKLVTQYKKYPCDIYTNILV